MSADVPLSAVAETIAQAADRLADANDSLSDRMRILSRLARGLVNAMPRQFRHIVNASFAEFEQHTVRWIANNGFAAAQLRALARELRASHDHQQMQVH